MVTKAEAEHVRYEETIRVIPTCWLIDGDKIID